MHTAQDIEQAIRAAANPDKVKTLSGFFKTGKGEYGEQDIFIGIPVPMTRSIVKQYLDTPLDQLEILLHNPIHELRMAALLCMVEQFKKADANRREAIYHTYLSNTAYINNWDLVDLSAAQIVGGYLEEQDHTPLYRLAQAASSGNSAFRLSPLGNGSAKAASTIRSLLPIFSCTTNMT